MLNCLYLGVSDISPGAGGAEAAVRRQVQDSATGSHSGRRVSVLPKPAASGRQHAAPQR